MCADAVQRPWLWSSGNGGVVYRMCVHRCVMYVQCIWRGVPI